MFWFLKYSTVKLYVLNYKIFEMSVCLSVCSQRDFFALSYCIAGISGSATFTGWLICSPSHPQCHIRVALFTCGTVYVQCYICVVHTALYMQHHIHSARYMALYTWCCICSTIYAASYTWCCICMGLVPLTIFTLPCFPSLLSFSGPLEATWGLRSLGSLQKPLAALGLELDSGVLFPLLPSSLYSPLPLLTPLCPLPLAP